MWSRPVRRTPLAMDQRRLPSVARLTAGVTAETIRPLRMSRGQRPHSVGCMTCDAGFFSRDGLMFCVARDRRVAVLRRRQQRYSDDNAERGDDKDPIDLPELH